MANERVLSVSEAVRIAKGAVSAIPTLVIIGEVSGFRGPNARSGHCYFEVKDAESSLSVIVWRGIYAGCGFKLKDGLRIQLTGSFDVYQGSGRLSFIVKSLSQEGEGRLRQQVAKLARKLEREGLMDLARKRPIPRFCTRVAVVTSLSGSVIEDVRRTLARRNPLVEILEVGCSVQGSEAPATIMRALDVAAAAHPDCILLVRGGGSFEDLMTFNDEALARAVAACPVPVVTGIGHEPDTSICDMVSDRRQSTPTAAAESVAPAFDELVSITQTRASRLAHAFGQTVALGKERVGVLSAELAKAMRGGLSSRAAQLDAYAARPCLTDPAAQLHARESDLAQTAERLQGAMPRMLRQQGAALAQSERHLRALPGRILRPFEAVMARSAGTLEALSPLKVLARGYAIVRDGRGRVVSHAASLARGQEVFVLLGQGSFAAQVSGIKTGNADGDVSTGDGSHRG